MFDFIKNIFTKRKEIKEDVKGNISEWSYQRFCQFYGNDLLKDPLFEKKISIILDQVNNYKEEDIDKICEKSGCSLNECVLKLKYLKNKRWIDSHYYINSSTRKIKKCSDSELLLINKYYDMVYLKHFQINEMLEELQKSDPSITREIILKELKDLSDNSLLNGIKIDENDNEILYYSLEKKKKASFYVTLNCPNCGALVDIPKNNSEKCGYCQTLVEDTYTGKEK